MNKIKVLLVYGGRSAEHKVSFLSAKSIYNALDKKKYHVHPVVISQSGQWFDDGDASILLNQESAAEDFSGVPVILDYAHTHQLMRCADGQWQAIEEINVIFPVLHGPMGEDGTIQGLFEMANLPYVGSGVLGSAAGMDKAVMRELFANQGLDQAQFEVLLHSDYYRGSSQARLSHIERHLGYPMFVKPANMGSSIGISKVDNREQLKVAIELAFQYDLKLVIETALTNVREIECSVLGNETARASDVIGEIIAGSDFYDYDTKYIDDKSQLVIPAEFEQGVINRIRDVAVQAFNAVGAMGLARVDMFVSKTNSRIVYINEINTMPGFTKISMYPKLWEASGLAYSDLLDELINLALERFHQRQRLSLTR